MCNKSSLYSEDLLLIDKLAQSNPDSAYSIIKTYNTTKLLTSYDSAFYNLLLAEIRYKTYYNDTTEKDISNAANFFLKKEDNYNAMRSLFYQGISRSNKGAYYPAIQSLLLAIEKSDSTKDFFFGVIFIKK